MAISTPLGEDNSGEGLHEFEHQVGQHTFKMSVEGEDGTTLYENVEMACAGCHVGLDTYNRTARADYDGLNGIEGIQDEVQGLLDLLLEKIEDAGAVGKCHRRPAHWHGRQRERERVYLGGKRSRVPADHLAQ